MKGKLRNKVLLDVAPKGRTKDVSRASEEARELREVLPDDMVIADELLQRMVDTIKSKYLRSALCSGPQKSMKSELVGGEKKRKRIEVEEEEDNE